MRPNELIPALAYLSLVSTLLLQVCIIGQKLLAYLHEGCEVDLVYIVTERRCNSLGQPRRPPFVDIEGKQ